MPDPDLQTRPLRIPDRTEWVLMRRPDVKVERIDQPTVLSLDQAIEWIKREKPLLWLGSIFSTPEPAGFPSGFDITSSLFSLILQGAVPVEEHEKLIQQLAPRWPLEALFDEFELAGFDVSESLLDFFSRQNARASPSNLHRAAALYYQRGYPRAPLCVTTNWDTLQETAFRESGFTVIVGGPGEMPGPEFGKHTSKTDVVFVYHPHGSFTTHDVVCSFRREQRQLSLHQEFLNHPTLFLGYSGYEPSLYMNLERNTGQLWCVRNTEDFSIPAKRRLLSRPNTFVYVGDLRDLLRGLGVLDSDVALQSKNLVSGPGGLPPKVLEVICSRILSSLHPGICASMLIHSLLSDVGEPEATIRYCFLMRALIDHIRDRTFETSVLGSLLASAHFRNSEQLWVTALAHLLRHDTNVSAVTAEGLLTRAGAAPSSGLEKEESAEDLLVYGFGACKQRTNIYKKFLGLRKSIIDGPIGGGQTRFDDEVIYTVTALISDDMGALGEFIEVLGFERLRDQGADFAGTYFDFAATCFYLRGLWNAGRLTEWAATNGDKMLTLARGRTLMIPIQPELSVRGGSLGV
jgi:hypothetical protein